MASDVKLGGVPSTQQDESVLRLSFFVGNPNHINLPFFLIFLLFKNEFEGDDSAGAASRFPCASI